MDTREAGEMIPHLLAQVYPDMFKEVLPGAAWKLRRGSSLTLICVLDDPPQVRITVGVVTNAPLGVDLSLAVNNVNRELWFGRAYMEGNWDIGKGSVLMQEIIVADLLSLQYGPSLQFVVTMIGTLTAKANELSPSLVERFGARPLLDDELGYLM